GADKNADTGITLAPLRTGSGTPGGPSAAGTSGFRSRAPHYVVVTDATAPPHRDFHGRGAADTAASLAERRRRGPAPGATDGSLLAPRPPNDVPHVRLSRPVGMFCRPTVLYRRKQPPTPT